MQLEALNCGNTNKSDFWKKVQAAGPKKSHSLPSSIDNISGTLYSLQLLQKCEKIDFQTC